MMLLHNLRMTGYNFLSTLFLLFRSSAFRTALVLSLHKTYILKLKYRTSKILEYIGPGLTYLRTYRYIVLFKVPTYVRLRGIISEPVHVLLHYCENANDVVFEMCENATDVVVFLCLFSIIRNNE